MFLFILAILLVVAAIVLFIVGSKMPKENSYGDSLAGTRLGLRIGSVAALIAALIATFFSSFYTQDPGEARVLRSFTGEVVGQDLTAGEGFKAPWVDFVEYNIRNQPASFIGDGSDTYNGQTPNGPQITTQDRDGATVNIDIVVNYSIRPDSVTSLYENYKDQENFVEIFIENHIRSITREVPNQFTTLEMRTDRAAVGLAIEERLADRWADQGVIVESVALQETRYSAEITASFDQAQQARINVEREQANLEAAEVSAQQRVVQANAEAEANRILAESLTPEILQQRNLDTMRSIGENGNLVIVPEGFNGLVSVGGQQ